MLHVMRKLLVVVSTHQIVVLLYSVLHKLASAYIMTEA
jgi:hypothetical protein